MHKCVLQVCCTPTAHLEYCCCFKVFASLFSLSSCFLNFSRAEWYNQFITVEFATYCFSAVGQCFRASCAFVEWNKDITTLTCSIIPFSVVIVVTLSTLTCRCCFYTLFTCASVLHVCFVSSIVAVVLSSSLSSLPTTKLFHRLFPFYFLSLCFRFFFFWVYCCLLCLCSS